VLKIRGAYGVDDELTDKTNDNDNVIFVDDDRWQFCQSIGMHLGYFWCLTELNELTDECTQNWSVIPLHLRKRGSMNHLLKR
jgi:hypothetical protein